MGIVSLQNVQYQYDARIVLEGVDWEIQRGEKVGLVGPNGSGKTTLFKLVMGELRPPIGTVTRARGLQIAYLPQEPQLDSANTLLAEVTSTFEHVRELEERVASVAQLIADHHDTDAERTRELMEEYDELHHRLEAAGGYKYEVYVKEVLGGLGFSPADYDLPISALSGGQKCRAALAQLLLQEADLLLLDEPTNHLDIEATCFLEKFLAGYHGACIVVSHDRYLLDRVVDKIADLDGRRITVYPCAYSDYAESKEVRLLTAQREFEKQQEWLQHQREYAQRVKADKSRAKQARGRMLHVERMEREGKVLERPTGTRRKMAIQFDAPARMGNLVLSCEGVSKVYGPKVLFRDFSVELYRGQKMGIIGPNGVGKSTLLKMALGKVPADSGVIRMSASLAVGYYDQEHAGLNEAHRVIDEIIPNIRGPQEGEIRSYLARFLFRGDDVYKRVGDLSGGEQSRVCLAKLVWQNPQVLILDEPTNHLDIPAKEVLEEALLAFEGAVLLVSHDRYFLDRVVNRLLVLGPEGQHEVLVGNWSMYEERLVAREAAERAAAEAAKKAAKPAARRVARAKAREAAGGVSSPYARWSLERLEQTIMELEDKLAATEAQFADPQVFLDPDRLRATKAEAEQIRSELAALNAEWESRAEEE